MKKLEVVVQCVVLCLAVSDVNLATRWWYNYISSNGSSGGPPESFVAYYDAALGQFDNNFCYKHETAIAFKPLLLTDIWRGFWRFGGLQIFCFMVLIHKLFKVRYGWILVIIAFSGFEDYLMVGNIQPILCLAALHPITALLAGVVKPYFLGFALLVALKDRYELSGNAGRIVQPEARHHTDTAALLHR